MLADSARPPTAARTRRDLVVLGVLLLAFQLPFARQALVIDDGAFVDQAHQILADPAAPYSFTIHLDRPVDFYAYFANPPLHAYTLAAAIGLFGGAELVLHLALLPFSALAVLAVYALARELTGHPLLVALLFLAAPAFQVTSHTVMADAPAAALTASAAWLFVRGLERGGRPWGWAAGAAAGLAGLFKYSCVLLLPAVCVYALARRRPRAALAPVLVGGALFLAWQLVSAALYGRPHVLAALAVEDDPKTLANRAVQAVAALTGLGGTVLFPPVLLLAAWAAMRARRHAAGAAALVAAGAAAALALPRYDHRQLAYPLPDRFLGALLLAAGVAAALFTVQAALAAWRGTRSDEPDEQRRAAQTLFLVAWFAPFLALDMFLLFATPKYLVPALAPLLLLLARSVPPAALRPGWGAIAWGTSAALALALGWASARQGDEHRRFTTRVVPRIAEDRTVWFTGHWTIRHYAQRAGMRPLPLELEPGAGPAPGDLVFRIPDAWQHLVPPAVEERLQPIAQRAARFTSPLHLANVRLRAGFWSHGLGALPYVVASRPLSDLEVYRVRED